MNNFKVSPFIRLIQNKKTPMDKGWSDDPKKRVPLSELKDIHTLGFVPPKGFLVIDADTKEAVSTIERMLELKNIVAFNYDTTRGKHFIFKTPESEYFDNLSSLGSSSIYQTGSTGSDIDIKAGGRNGKNGYLKIKEGEHWRVSPKDLMDAFNDETPIAPLTLLISKKHRMYINDYATKGRDDTVFGWLPKLVSYGMDEETFIQFAVELKLMNNDQETLGETAEWAKAKWDSSKQMGAVVKMEGKSVKQKIVRPISMKVAQFNPAEPESKKWSLIGINDYQWLASEIINVTGLCYSADDDQIWGVQFGGFRPIKDLNLFVKRILIKKYGSVKPAVTNDITSYLIGSIPIKEFTKDRNLISFNGTVINAKDGKIQELNETQMIQNIVPHKLISKDALKTTHLKEYEFLDKTLNGWTKGSSVYKKQLLERVGLSMTKNMTYEKAFFLIGSGSNGKSVFLKMLVNLIGNDNTSHEDLKELSADKFSSSNLYGKLANINLDISSDVIYDTSLFKKIVSGDIMSAAYKGIDKFKFESYAKQWFGANNIPASREIGDSDAVNRRIEVMPFFAVFDKNVMGNKEIENFMNEIESEKVIEVFARISLDALTKALNSKWTLSKISKDAFERYKKDYNHFYDFIEESGVKGNETTIDAHKRYKIWCKQYDFKYFALREFVKKYENAARSFGINMTKESINGRKGSDKHRIIVEQDS